MYALYMTSFLRIAASLALQLAAVVAFFTVIILHTKRGYRLHGPPVTHTWISLPYINNHTYPHPANTDQKNRHVAVNYLQLNEGGLLYYFFFAIPRFLFLTLPLAVLASLIFVTPASALWNSTTHRPPTTIQQYQGAYPR